MYYIYLHILDHVYYVLHIVHITHMYKIYNTHYMMRDISHVYAICIYIIYCINSKFVLYIHISYVHKYIYIYIYISPVHCILYIA